MPGRCGPEAGDVMSERVSDILDAAVAGGLTVGVILCLVAGFLLVRAID